MITSLNNNQLKIYIAKQLSYIFPDSDCEDVMLLLEAKYINTALERLNICFRAIKLKYYQDSDNNVLFDHLNSDHYCMFLYLLANSVYISNGSIELCKKLFYLNKALHGIDAFYSIKLPEIFLFVHPIGTILGNAVYNNYFVVYQNCTVGANQAGVYPIFSEGTLLYSKSSVIGSCKLGANVVLGANSFIVDSNIADTTLVVGAYPDNRLLDNKINIKSDVFLNKICETHEQSI